MVLQRPFTHVSNTLRINSVNNQVRIINRPEIIAQAEDFHPRSAATDYAILLYTCNSGNADLMMMFVEIAQLNFWILRNFKCLVVGAQVGNVDRKSVGSDRRNGANTSPDRHPSWQDKEICHFATRPMPSLSTQQDQSVQVWVLPWLYVIAGGYRVVISALAGHPMLEAFKCFCLTTHLSDWGQDSQGFRKTRRCVPF